MSKNEMSPRARNFFAALAAAGIPVRFDEPLSRHTYLRIGGPAEVYAEPRTPLELAQLLQVARDVELPWFVLGSGANLLVPDAGVQGLVIQLKNMNGIDVADNTVQLGAGVRLGRAIQSVCREGLGGLESLAGIPATLGGAIAMNAGGRYGEIGQYVTALDVVSPDGVSDRWTGDQLHFTYRHGHIGDRIVVGVEVALEPGNAEALKARALEVLREKESEQPYGDRSAGCTFRNPDGDFAGRLIDAAGLKGLREGGACVSDVHANFIVNDEGASGDDILRLVDRVRSTVMDRFGVELELELVVWRATLNDLERKGA